MPFYSPLRYPGGKRRLVASITRLLEANRLKDIEYAEPYCGGASIALALLFDEYAATIHINDLSRPVYAFWHTVLNDTAALCHRIEKTKVTMREWHRQRAVYEHQADAPLSELGFAAFFLNRTNRSGIITGGVIGGQDQSGKWKLDARFSKDELVRRIRRIARYRSRINLYQQDALEFTNGVVTALPGNAFVFYDPPYIDSGASLYLNRYELNDHRQLARRVMTLDRSWAVTYDYQAAVRHNLYPMHRRVAFTLWYNAQERRGGQEAMFLSQRLTLPADWRVEGDVRISAPRSAYPIFGRLEAMPGHSETEEGPKAAKRFVSALKTVLSVPKDSVPNPFGKSKGKKKPAKSEDEAKD